VDVNGISYGVFVPLSTFRYLPRLSEDVTLNTHLLLKEDGLVLYGFSTLEEKALFQLLISASGIGPKIALSILSFLEPAEARKAIKNGDLSILTTVPGVGKKLAAKIVFELKERAELSALLKEGSQAGDGLDKISQDALAGLINLGYNQTEARKALRDAIGDLGRSLELEELIREALKRL
jgi:Holliday junction DNA helicase RuvA